MLAVEEQDKPLIVEGGNIVVKSTTESVSDAALLWRETLLRLLIKILLFLLRLQIKILLFMSRSWKKFLQALKMLLLPWKKKKIIKTPKTSSRSWL